MNLTGNSEVILAADQRTAPYGGAPITAMPANFTHQLLLK